MFKVNNRKTRTRCEICSKLTIKTPERRQKKVFLKILQNFFLIKLQDSDLNPFLRHSGVFIVNFEHISHLVLVFLLLTWSR